MTTQKKDPEPIKPRQAGGQGANSLRHTLADLLCLVFPLMLLLIGVTTLFRVSVFRFRTDNTPTKRSAW